MRKLSQGVFEISRPHIQEVFEQETKTDILIAVKVKAAQSCPTLCDPMDYLVHGIPQARILEWVDFPFSKVSSQPRDRTQISCIAGRFFTSWATREIQEYWSRYPIPSNIIWLQSLHFYHQNTVTLKKLAVMAAAPPPPSNKNFDDSLMATKHPRPLQKILHPWHWVILPSLKMSSNCFLVHCSQWKAARYTWEPVRKSPWSCHLNKALVNQRLSLYFIFLPYETDSPLKLGTPAEMKVTADGLPLLISGLCSFHLRILLSLKIKHKPDWPFQFTIILK